MDIEMPEMNGIEAVRIGKILFPEIIYLMLTVFDDDDKIFEAIKAGANGYLLKDERVNKIIEFIEQILLEGGAPMSPHIARKTLKLLMNAHLNPEESKLMEGLGPEDKILSDREMEVLILTVEGYDYKAIADKLFLSNNTIRKHISNIYQKLHITSKAQAIKYANKKGWIKN
jgi:DNA-binding NarL/FixJ family response regulator